jgi:Inhibitor of vertebrate lysozyme (Ivy)
MPVGLIKPEASAMRALFLALAAISLLGLTPASAQEPEGPYLPDLMEQPAYLAAWTSIVAGEKLPAWLNTFTKTQNAVSTPVKTMSVGGQDYTLGWICEPHNCGDAQAYVLFAPEARQAWGLVISEGTKQQWLGKPDDAVKAAILSGVQ